MPPTLIDAEDAARGLIAQRAAAGSPFALQAKADDLALYCDHDRLLAALGALLDAAEAEAAPGAEQRLTIDVQAQWVCFAAPAGQAPGELARIAASLGGAVTVEGEALILRLPAADWSPSHAH